MSILAKERNAEKAIFRSPVKLNKPGHAQGAQIWKLKLPGLSKAECDTFAGKYQLSGGQIDNIARKREIREIIYGSKCNLNDIINFCEEEAIGREHAKIGYMNRD